MAQALDLEGMIRSLAEITGEQGQQMRTMSDQVGTLNQTVNSLVSEFERIGGRGARHDRDEEDEERPRGPTVKERALRLTRDAPKFDDEARRTGDFLDFLDRFETRACMFDEDIRTNNEAMKYLLWDALDQGTQQRATMYQPYGRKCNTMSFENYKTTLTEALVPKEQSHIVRAAYTNLKQKPDEEISGFITKVRSMAPRAYGEN